MLGCPLNQQIIYGFGMVGAGFPIPAPRLFGPRWIPNERHKGIPLVFFRRDDHNVPVPAREDTSRHAHLVARAGHDYLIVGIGDTLYSLHGDQSLLLAHVNVLSPTGNTLPVKRGQHRHHRHQSRVAVAGVTARLNGWSVGVGGEKGEQIGLTAGMGHIEGAALVIPVRSGEPVGGNGHDDETVVDSTQVFIPKAHLFHIPGRVIFHQDVRTFGQFQEDLFSSGLFRIKRDSPFVGVKVEKKAALFRMGFVLRKRGHLPGRVSIHGWLDLDHLGSQIGHYFCAVGTAHQRTVFQDFYAFQRAFVQFFCFLVGF